MNTNNTNNPFKAIFAESWRPEKTGDVLAGEVYDMGNRMINDNEIPFIRLIDSWGVEYEVLCGNASLSQFADNNRIEIGAYIGLRYDGESKTIERLGHKMKMYSGFVFPRDDWFQDENGNIVDNENNIIFETDYGKSVTSDTDKTSPSKPTSKKRKPSPTKNQEGIF